METLTNILDYQINREAIDKDFCIVSLSSEENYIYSKFLENPEINAIAISYGSGKKAYVLMYKDDYDSLYDCDILKTKNITYKKMNINNVFDYMLIQLFLNALTNYNSDGCYNNLTGKFYKFLDSKGKTIRALNFYVNNYDKYMLLNGSVTSFILASVRYYDKPLYTLTGNNKTLKRIFSHVDGPCYIEGNYKNKKASYNFLNLKDGSGRAKELFAIINLFNRQFSEYISIRPVAVEIEEKIDNTKFKLKDKTLELIKNHNFHLCNYVTGLEYTDTVKSFVKYLKQQGYNVSSFKKPSKNSLNIIILHDDEYYKKYHMQDPHQNLDSGIVAQHIIIENLSSFFDIYSPKISPQLVTVFKELLIKDDIINKTNHFSFVDWKQFDFNGAYTFIIRPNKKSNDLFKMVIEPNGDYKIYKEEIDLFNAYENSKIIKLFEENKNIELVIIDQKGNINAIERTDIITLPDEKLLDNGKVSKSKQTKSDLYPGLCDIDFYKINNDIFYNVGQTLSNIQFNISKASHFYKVHCIDNSICFMKDILKLMSVDFVKYNELTVLPFPVKYLREYANMYSHN